MTYKVSEKAKSQIYTTFLPLLNEGSVVLLDHQRTIAQLVGLERRTSFGGVSDKIDHGPGGHDDLANALAGACVNVGMGRGVQPGARDHRPPRVLLGYPNCKKAGKGITPDRRRESGMSMKFEIEAAGMVQSERENIGSQGYQIELRRVDGDGRKKYTVYNAAGMEMASAWGREQAVAFVEQLTKKGTISH